MTCFLDYKKIYKPLLLINVTRSGEQVEDLKWNRKEPNQTLQKVILARLKRFLNYGSRNYYVSTGNGWRR
jgi:hypothetical protein